MVSCRQPANCRCTASCSHLQPRFADTYIESWLQVLSQEAARQQRRRLWLHPALQRGRQAWTPLHLQSRRLRGR